jgi:hypothetical protein
MVFLLAQGLVKRAKEVRHGGTEQTKTVYLLSGRIKYVPSGRAFVAYNRGKGGVSYRHKKFTDPETGVVYPNVEISATAIEDFVWAHVRMAVDKPQELYKRHAKYATSEEELARLRGKQEKLAAEMRRNEGYIDSTEDRYVRGEISANTREKLVKKYEQATEHAK